MADLPRTPSFDSRITHTSTRPFHEVRDMYDTEVHGLLRLLIDKSLSEPVRNGICKYLTVTIFAALDYFFRNSVRVLIDKHNLNTDAIFPSNSKPKLEKKIQENNTTVGAVVSSTYSLYDVLEIDFVFSNLFHMDSYLDYLIKQNAISQTRFALDGHPLPIEYHKLIQAYELRNNIAHEVTQIKISNSRTIAMWDNLGNIMDLSQSFFHSLDDADHRRILDSLYENGKEKMVKSAIYKLCSDRIMSELLKDKKLGYIGKQSDIANIIRSIPNLGSLINDNNFERIIAKMRVQGLVSIDSESITLRIKGEKRLKSTSKNDRDRCKREISPIVCSWLMR